MGAEGSNNLGRNIVISAATVTTGIGSVGAKEWDDDFNKEAARIKSGEYSQSTGNVINHSRSETAQIQQEVNPLSTRLNLSQDRVDAAITYVKGFTGIQLAVERVSGDADFRRVAGALGFQISDKMILTFSASELEDRIVQYKQNSAGLALYISELTKFIEYLEFYIVYDDVKSLDSKWRVNGIGLQNGNIGVNETRTVGGSDTRYGATLGLRPLKNMLIALGGSKSDEITIGTISLDTKFGKNGLYGDYQYSDPDNTDSREDYTIGAERKIGEGEGFGDVRLGLAYQKIDFGEGLGAKRYLSLVLRAGGGSTTNIDKKGANMETALDKSTENVSVKRSDKLEKESRNREIAIAISAPTLNIQDGRILIAPGFCEVEEGTCALVGYEVTVNGITNRIAGSRTEIPDVNLSDQTDDNISIIAMYSVMIEGQAIIVPSASVNLNIEAPELAIARDDRFGSTVESGGDISELLDVTANDGPGTISNVQGRGFVQEGNKIRYTAKNVTKNFTTNATYDITNADGQVANARVRYDARVKSVETPNEKPDINDDILTAAVEGVKTAYTNAALTGNDTDDKDTPTVVADSFTNISGGLVVQTTNGFDVTPNLGATEVTFTYTGEDSEGLKDTADVSIPVEKAEVPVPDTPSTPSLDATPAPGATSASLTANNIAAGNTVMWFLNGTAVPNETGTGLSLTGLSIGSYDVSIQECNASGCSENSDDISFEITEAPDTEPPVGISVMVDAGGTKLASGSISITDDTDPSPDLVITLAPAHGNIEFTGEDFDYEGTNIGYVGDDEVKYKLVDDAGNESPEYTIKIKDLAIFF